MKVKTINLQKRQYEAYDKKFVMKTNGDVDSEDVDLDNVHTSFKVYRRSNLKDFLASGELNLWERKISEFYTGFGMPTNNEIKLLRIEVPIYQLIKTFLQKYPLNHLRQLDLAHLKDELMSDTYQRNTIKNRMQDLKKQIKESK